MGSFKSFEELACWKESRILRNYVKDEIIPQLPNSEKFGLISQISRSSRSIGNNIAEEKLNNFRELYNKTLKILNGYIKYLKDAKLKEGLHQ